jgi:hypothetical protein
MSNHPTQSIKAASLASAQHQLQMHNAQAHQQELRAGQQTARYKNATFRTSLAMVKPGGMARAMLAKLKPRPKPTRLPEGGVHAARGEPVESSAEDEGSGRGLEGAATGGEANRKMERVSEEAPDRDRSSDEENEENDDSPEGSGSGGSIGHKRVRLRAVARVSAAGGGGRGGGGSGIGVMTALRAQWADAAMDRGGLVELRRALVDRLLGAARGSDMTGWRKDWMGNVAAAYAARYGHTGAESLAGEAAPPNLRDVFIECSKAMPADRLLPHRARETMFCLLWPAVHGLDRPRTEVQVLAMMVRLAALVRISSARRHL